VLRCLQAETELTMTLAGVTRPDQLNMTNVTHHP
jgi:hypothetical protein